MEYHTNMQQPPPKAIRISEMLTPSNSKCNSKIDYSRHFLKKFPIMNEIVAVWIGNLELT